MEPAPRDAIAPWRAALWIVVIVGASLGFSRAFACATPFVALAAVAGTQTSVRTGGFAVFLTWLANQAVGFGLLHYPHTWETLAWGVAIGLAAMAAWVCAISIARATNSSMLRVGLAFLAGFVAYEGLLHAATYVLPTEGNAFTVAIVGRIFLVNVVACIVLLALQAVATSVELVPPRLRPTSARASASTAPR